MRRPEMEFSCLCVCSLLQWLGEVEEMDGSNGDS